MTSNILWHSGIMLALLRNEYEEVNGHKTHEVSSTYTPKKLWYHNERKKYEELLYEGMIYVVKLKIWLHSMNYYLTNESQ
jgi:hypothetical protein